ncbi:MAG: PDZ domain-containing protein, partial [Planctomycetes bacterium]|nr:PDZ domain-containing protein [Planctomycetota bacterium]
LGPLGGRAEVVADRATIEVLTVQDGAPAHRAGLREGDVIVAIDGAAPPQHSRDIDVLDGPMKALGDAILAHEDGEPLPLTVRRGDQTVQLRVAVPSFPEFYDGVVRDLLATRRDDGSWRANTGEDASRYTTALCGLALLGYGDPAHRDALAKVAAYLAGPQRRAHLGDTLLEPAGLSNWFLTMSGIFLSEYVLATGDEQWLPTIQLLCDAMAARQTEQGRYGHGVTVGYGGKGLNIINTHAHLMWALAERAGCEVDRTAWQRSFAEIEKSTGENGGVRYWTLQTGYWDACARTGQMALALSLRGEQEPLRRRMAGYLAAHGNRMREAHATGSIGMIFGSAALRRIDRQAFRRHLENWRWYAALMLQPDGSAGYVGGKRNNGGDRYLGEGHVANAIAGLMMACERGRLHLCGNDERGWLARRTPLPPLTVPDGERPERWQRDMERFAADEARAPTPPHAVVFVGSSSIRRWRTLAKDMAPVPVVQRGFGGSRLFYACYWCQQLLAPHPSPSAVVVFSGTNDIAGERPKSAERVQELFALLVERIHRLHPGVPICFVAITPTAARAEHRAIVDAANERIRADCEASPLLEFVDPTPGLLTPDGAPDPRFFAKDALHLNAAGYRVWTRQLRPLVARLHDRARSRRR